MRHKCYTLQMSDSIVSLQYSNHSGPSSLEACLKVLSHCMGVSVEYCYPHAVSGVFAAHQHKMLE